TNNFPLVTREIARDTLVFRKNLLSRNVRGRLSPKELGSQMRNYELMAILAPEVQERTVQPSLDIFVKVITAAKVIAINVDSWGRRRLAYDLNKKSEGIYAVVDFSASRATAQELDRQLGLNESVLRTKLIRPDAR